MFYANKNFKLNSFLKSLSCGQFSNDFHPCEMAAQRGDKKKMLLQFYSRNAFHLMNYIKSENIKQTC